MYSAAAELARWVKSCYVTPGLSAAPGGDTVIADGAEKLGAERLSGNPARKTTDE